MTEEKFHESAYKHVSGEAVYVDDISVSEQLLFGKVVYSTHAHARIKSIHTKEAKALSGVKAVLTAADIPGENQMGPVVRDEPCLAGNEVQFIGQAIALIAAESEEICRKAERLLQIEYEPLPAVLTIDEAIKQNALLGPERKIERGEPATALKEATHVIEGELRTGAQEHWYLETQAALCLPGEDDEMMVYSSTQHPSETQAVVAEVLGIRRSDVTVEVRRLGGGFGGKETQANHIAV
ncbi:MAG TPA: xanthine dehydrogenase molybdopterin binding subunit, partial [Caldithrix abyssi]|nr:xanthine dehydrogenase molybdopterin binding subunit [Caldithrix abyssi]